MFRDLGPKKLIFFSESEKLKVFQMWSEKLFFDVYGGPENDEQLLM